MAIDIDIDIGIRRKSEDVAARRPPNRKALIRSAATDLFVRRGYHNVSVADVAETVGITPAALYHHYRNKQDLLLHTVLDALDTVDTTIRTAGDLDAAIRALTALVVGPGNLLAVWERESRHLEESQRAAVQDREADIVADFLPLLRAERPDLDAPEAELVARAVLGTLGGQSLRRGAPRRKEEALVFRLAAAVARAPLTPAPTRPPEPEPAPGPYGTGTSMPRRRRDQLLTEAVRLFDERGYQSVTMADIGEAAGIVASGVYRHFPSKTDILVTAMNRGGEQLRTGAERAFSLARSADEVLALLLRAHVSVTVEQRHLVGLLTHERNHLPNKERTALRHYQVDYMDVWLQALGAVEPEYGDSDLRTVVHAAHAMIHFVVRTTTAPFSPDLPERLTELGTALLSAKR
ncbi:TetR family transcriptional regulator [Streptomyces sp. NPDC047315]|uniref:TetR/AcrR family transcriptional regulator n=1 Tax=Streptomyces sp. NPDC047315 TaxID=3155142 RepID=UPI0033EDB147